jgi:membrane protein DedA with SNARE-associated domain
LFDTIAGYLSAFGLGGLLLGVFVESMGIPFPGGVMVIITGFLVHQGELNFSSALIAILSSYTAGSLIAYLIGKKAGRPFFARCGQLLHISPDRFEQTRSWLDHSAPAFIIFGRFLPGLGNLTPYMAGISRTGLGYFLFYNSVFAVSWGSLYLLLGMFFGYNYRLITEQLNSKLPLAALGLMIIFLIFMYTKKRLRQGRKT